MRLGVLICLLFYNSILVAQPPDIDDSIMMIKGKWEKREAASGPLDNKIPKSDRSIISKNIEKFLQLFKETYPVPTGGDAGWYPDIGDHTIFPNGPHAYAYRSLLFYYYYNTAYKKIVRTVETGTWAYIFVNNFGWLLESSPLQIEVEGKKKNVWELPALVDTWKGYPRYASFRGTAKYPHYCVLITRDGKLPWVPITQLQFLEAIRKKTTNEKEKMIIMVDSFINGTRKSISDIKASTRYTNDQKTAMITPLQKVLDQKIASRDNDIAKNSTLFDKDIKIIDDYINSTDQSTLQSQAITDGRLYFKGKFTDPASPQAKFLVYANPQFFDKTLPLHSPQLITLYWRWNDNAPGRFFREKIENNFPVEKLAAMLGR